MTMKDRAPVEELLSTSDLQIQTAETAWRHVHAEYVDVVDDILATLAPSGPYAYTVSPSVEDGKEIPTQRIVATYDDIAATYRAMHRFAAVVAIRPVTQITSSWYTFISGLGRGRMKETGEESERPVIVLFPTMGSEGITGELFWGRTQRATLPGDPADGALAGRFAVAGVHETLLEAYRKGDIDTIVGAAHPEIQTGVRDYVAQTGTLVQLHTKEALEEHLRGFYDHYTVRALDVVNRHLDDWFFFHELRWTVEARRGPDAGRVLRHHTAEYAEVSAAGLVVAHIGHGTEQMKTD
ncbi:hypothetical protein [Streptomyces ipomoeae]|uniref:hypothetical protein n=1 Tax=Streptomyces ipomoeae TaxID=103232 RepID=UPI0011479048|nr:hypothetical protein [Streptomyces ipomoeae]MDX2937859.1 hypothetical protein [Streptomyces ipomoeae]TQE28237.1 hypothetical protein SipoB123_10270 [Streptomyces ipomoeae]